LSSRANTSEGIRHPLHSSQRQNGCPTGSRYTTNRPSGLGWCSCRRDRVHVEVEVHLRGDRAVGPGGRAEGGNGLARERDRARLALWRQDIDPIRVLGVVTNPPAEHRGVELGERSSIRAVECDDHTPRADPSHGTTLRPALQAPQAFMDRGSFRQPELGRSPGAL